MRGPGGRANAKMENGKGAQIGTEAGQDTRKGALTHHAKRGASADREQARNRRKRTAERG